MISLPKSIARHSKFVHPGILSNVVDIVDERIPCVGHRRTITFVIPAKTSMFEEYIDDEFTLSARDICTRIKAVNI